MKWFWFGIFGLLDVHVSLAQCPIADFAASAEVCLNQQSKFENQASNSVAYEWFFCDTDYAAILSKEKILSDFGAVYNSQFVHNGVNLYLFFVSQTQNKLVGLRFLNEDAWDYEVHSEIDLSAVITNPAGIDIVNEDGVWRGLLTSIVSPFKLVRVVFGADFKTLASVDDLSSLVSLSTPFDVRILRNKMEYLAFVTNSTATVDKQLVRLSFGTSLSNIPTVDYIGLPSGSAAASVDVYNTCDTWAAYVSSRNGKLFRIDLGSDPKISGPLVTDLALTAPLNDPGGLAVLEDHDELVLILQSRNGNTYSGKLTSVLDNTVDITDLGNINSTNRDWGVAAYRLKSDYKIVSASFGSGSLGGLYALSFAERCPANKEISTLTSDTIAFHETGTFKVTLNAMNSEGEFHVATKEITVTSQQAPQLTIKQPDLYCVDSSVPFEITSDLLITEQNWSFGDGVGTSSQPSPTYTYSESGIFDVTVNATAENGCSNFVASQIIIFQKPKSDFQLTPTLLCTNNEFLFPTTTPDIYDGHLSYEWYVDENLVSQERDLKYTFINTGSKEIKLKTSIPGCSDEITKSTSSVEAGPVVDFSYTGTCEDELFSFQNQIADAVESYHWDFGNSQTSDAPNAVHTFSDYGDFSVSLAATNDIGCETIERKTITVQSKPLVAFDLRSLSNACSNAITFFENYTTNPDNRPVTEWLWQYNDNNEPAVTTLLNGEHLFTQPGTYPVSLTATTSAGCTATTEKAVTILPSPATTFTFTPACEDVPVHFTGPDDPNIETSYWEFGTSYSYEPSPIHTFAAPGDHHLYAEFHGANGCISTVERTVRVPIPLNPDFSVLRNCVNHETLFTNITRGIDAVTNTEWTFSDAVTASGSSATQTFAQEGTETVTMHVTAASGCAYKTTKNIQILAAPVARFLASPETGAFPLEVTFTNTSTLANRFRWNFMDNPGSTSDVESPMHTFSALGSFEVALTAYNGQQCEATFVKTISTVEPFPDADVEKITMIENPDGSTKLVVTIHNKGNTILKDLPLTFDFSGNLFLSETAPETIMPGSQYNFVLNSSIQNPQSPGYLCVSIELANDRSPDGNRSCSALEAALSVFAYPNPASGSLQIEWVAQNAGNVTLTLVDHLGREVFHHAETGRAGLNSRMLDLKDASPGVYLLLVKSASSKIARRILVTN